MGFNLNKFLTQGERDINKIIQSVEIEFTDWVKPRIICANGFSFSVQASQFHHCRPRNNEGPYTHVEIGFPSVKIEELMPYCEDSDDPTETVYSYVPIEIVESIIEANGGVISA